MVTIKWLSRKISTVQRRQFLLTSGTALASVLGAASTASASSSYDYGIRSFDVEPTWESPTEPEIERDAPFLHVSGVAEVGNTCTDLAIGDLAHDARTPQIELAPVKELSDAARSRKRCYGVSRSLAYDVTLVYDVKTPADAEVTVSRDAADAPLARSASFEVGDEQPHQVTRRPGTNRAIVSGSVLGRDACERPVYAGTDVQDDVAFVDLVTTEPSSRVVCAQVLREHEYEIDLQFRDELPDRFAVRVDGERAFSEKSRKKVVGVV